MSGTVNVDTLVDVLLSKGARFVPGSQFEEFQAALSDLAARAREAEEDAERAEAAEQEVRFLLSDPDMRQIRKWIEQREARLARRVAELEAALTLILSGCELARPELRPELRRFEEVARAALDDGQGVAELEAALRVYREAYAAVLAHAEGLRMDTPEDERVRLKLVQLLHEVDALAGDGGGA